MTDKTEKKMEEVDEETRIRERLKAKKAQKHHRESNGSSSTAASTATTSPTTATDPASKKAKSPSSSGESKQQKQSSSSPQKKSQQHRRGSGGSGGSGGRSSSVDRPVERDGGHRDRDGERGRHRSSRRHHHHHRHDNHHRRNHHRGHGYRNEEQPSGRGGGGGWNGYDTRHGPPPGPPPPHFYARGGPPPPFDPYYPPAAAASRGVGGGGGPPAGPHPPPGRYDDFGRQRPPRRPSARSRSRSLSRSRSRSYSSDESSSRSRSPSRSRSRSRSVSSRSSYSDASDDDDASSSRSSMDSTSDAESRTGNDDNNKNKKNDDEVLYSKDQRTVFVTQLVQRTTEKDLKRYFSKTHDLKVNEVILLRDKRTGRHKGCAYVEFRRMQDIPKAVALSNQAPSFQRFPILVKASEAEKNYLENANTAGAVAAAAAAAATTVPQPTKKGPLTAVQMGITVPSGPIVGENGKLLESQKVYVGSLDPSVSQEHLFVLFSQFGQLEKVAIQQDSATGISKGFAFLSFRHPQEANLAIQTMSSQVLAGRPIKTGWAVNQIASYPGAQVVTSDKFPADASTRATSAYKVLSQLNMGVPPSQITLQTVTPAATTTTTTTTETTATMAQAAPIATAATVQPVMLQHQVGTTNTAMAASATGAAVSRIPTVAEARASLAAGATGLSAPTLVTRYPQVAAAAAAAAATAATSSSTTTTTSTTLLTDHTKIGNADCPSTHILVHNMYNKDEETEPGWEIEIKEAFEEECAKFGKITNVTVMSKEVGGKIYASFETIQGAQSCASSLAGRWFDKRMLSVEFVPESKLPPKE